MDLRSLLATTSQAAELLGVSDARVRQLIQTDEFPRPLLRHGHTRLFRRADVVAYKERAVRSCIPSMLAPARDPVTLRTDTVWRPRAPHIFAFGGPHALHLRIYDRGDVVVVLLSELLDRYPRRTGTVPLATFTDFAEIATAVDREFLDGLITSKVCWIWISAVSPETGDSDERVNVFSVILAQPGGPGAPWIDPLWSPLSIEELGKLLGGADLDWFHWRHYTVQNINAWNATDGSPVKVYDDPYGLKPFVGSIQTIEEATPPLTSSEREACQQTLLIELTLRNRAKQKAGQKHSERGCGWRGALLPPVTTTDVLSYEIPCGLVKQLPELQECLIPYSWALANHNTITGALQRLSSEIGSASLSLLEALGAATAASLDVLRLVGNHHSFGRDSSSPPPGNHLADLGQHPHSYATCIEQIDYCTSLPISEASTLALGVRINCSTHFLPD